MNKSILAKIRWPRPFAGLRGIKLADVPREASAGVTLAALMIPLNIGYRWLYMDYETGNGASRFKYDLLNQGPQLGITFHF